MIKLLSITSSLVIASTFINSVYAMPSQKFETVKKWTYQHSFLPPNLIEDISFPGLFFVERELTNGKTIKFEVWVENGFVIGENIVVTVPEEKFEDDKINLFDRQNPATLRLIELIYGKELAKDFQNSKFIYEGFNYYSFNEFDNKIRLTPPTRNNFFEGKYSYSSALSRNSPHGDRGDRQWTFTITNIKSSKVAIANLEKEKQIFLKEEAKLAIEAEKLRQKKEQEELLKRRNEPADIDI